jgi:hypothetical protein
MSETAKTAKTAKTANSFLDIFSQKYNDFAEDLLGALPELTPQIKAALALSSAERLRRFNEEVGTNLQNERDPEANPGTVLPGVTIPKSIWPDLGNSSRAAIQEHLTVLAMCSAYEKLKEGMLPEDFMKEWSEKVKGIDFSSVSKKLTDMFTKFTPNSLPKIPERLMKGHLAKLAEELVREFKPEDFGLSEAELKACDDDPARAFTLLTELYTKRPEVLQNAIKRIGKRLQEKVQRGELRPEQIAAEAEEILKEFTGDGAFKEMLESFRTMFGMEDPDLAREVGRDGDARRNLVRERLRKKMAAKQAGKHSTEK